MVKKAINKMNEQGNTIAIACTNVYQNSFLK